MDPIIYHFLKKDDHWVEVLNANLFLNKNASQFQWDDFSIGKNISGYNFQHVAQFRFNCQFEEIITPDNIEFFIEEIGQFKHLIVDAIPTQPELLKLFVSLETISFLKFEYSGEQQDFNKLDLTFLGNCKNLVSLFIKNFAIHYLVLPLQRLENLKHLYIEETLLEDFSFASEFNNLEKLSLAGNQNLVNISFLTSNNSLRELDLRNTAITDFSVLRQVPDLEIVHPFTKVLRAARLIKIGDARLENKNSLKNKLFGPSDARAQETRKSEFIYFIHVCEEWEGGENFQIGNEFSSFKDAYVYLRNFLNRIEINGHLNSVNWVSPELALADMLYYGDEGDFSFEIVERSSREFFGDSFENYWSCDVCGGNQKTGCLHFDPTECPRGS